MATQDAHGRPQAAADEGTGGSGSGYVEEAFEVRTPLRTFSIMLGRYRLRN